jgi:hypothetical protein
VEVRGTPAQKRIGRRAVRQKPPENGCLRGANLVDHSADWLLPATLRRTRPDLFKVLPLTSWFEPEPDGMEEKRKYPRTEVDEPAYVSSGGSVMRCVVRNISREGAAIDVENPAFVPQRFRLVMAKDSSIVHECRVTWIQKNRIGLTFVDQK